MELDAFKKLPLMGIIRGIAVESTEPLVEAVLSSGLITIEVAMNTPGAASIIRKMVELAQGKLTIGAGTVLTLKDLKTAQDAGASFIVSPVLVKPVVSYCVERAIPVFPGALTPQEIYTAWEAGAAMVKVFPAKMFGPEYIKEVKGPFDGIELLACGGVTPHNIGSFFESGAAAVAFGATIFNLDSIQKKDFKKIQQEIKNLIRAFSEIKTKIA